MSWEFVVYQLGIYTKVFRLSWGEILEYRLSFLMRNLRYPLSVWLMYFVWQALSQHTGQNANQLTTYFLLSTLVFGWSNMHTWYVEEDIKYGHLNKLLTRPIKPLLYYCVYQLGATLSSFMIQAFLVLIMSLWLKPQLNYQLTTWLLVLGFFGLTYLFTFVFLYTLSLMSVWLTEVYALRWAYLNIMRFITGLYIPLVFFPTWWQKFLFFTPFPHLASTPIGLIQGNISPQAALPGMIVLMAWVGVIFIIHGLVWRQAHKAYEGSGG